MILLGFFVAFRPHLVLGELETEDSFPISDFRAIFFFFGQCINVIAGFLVAIEAFVCLFETVVDASSHK